MASRFIPPRPTRVITSRAITPVVLATPVTASPPKILPVKNIPPPRITVPIAQAVPMVASGQGQIIKGTPSHITGAIHTAIRQVISQPSPSPQSSPQPAPTFDVATNLPTDQSLAHAAASGVAQSAPAEIYTAAVTENPSETPQPSQESAKMANTLSQGSQGPDVLALQNGLAQLAYDVPQNGVYGPETAQAVGMFQSDNELPVTMEADDATLAMLKDALRVLKSGKIPIGTQLFENRANATKWIALGAIALGLGVIYILWLSETDFEYA